MLGSSSHQDRSHKDPPPPLPPPHLRTPPVDQNSHNMRELLLIAAQLISRSDLSATHRLISVLSSNSSAYGDSSDRLIHSFTKALALLLNIIPPSTSIINHMSHQHDDQALHSSYLSLNQITPFIRFNHLTANQAIIELINNQSHQHQQHQQHQQNLHILDFDIMHGVQWPPLIQAISSHHSPITLRITATGTNLTILHQTGDRLSKFAHSYGLIFHFYPILLANYTNTGDQTLAVDHLIDSLSTVLLLPNETLAVNCVLHLHRYLNNREKLCLLLRKIKSMNPRVVTLSEKEANFNHPIFLTRFTEAVNYYGAVFEALEATLPGTSRERMEVEQVWCGREIADIVALEGEYRKERHERFRSWEVMMMSAGLVKVPLSGYALSQARLLLRLHYPCEGYNIGVVDDCFFLGWRNQPLFFVSSWH